MWPVRAGELESVVASVAAPATGTLAPEIAAEELRRAIAWPGLPPCAGDVLFAIERGLHAQVRSALTAGAFCVVARDWNELASLEPSLRARCFVARRPLDAYRIFAAHLRAGFTFPVVAIGGSNGKTTTKDLLAGILAEGGRHVTCTRGTDNGWAGTPTTLCRPDHTAPAPNALVLEIGIDERGAMREHARLAAPDVAVLTALGPEHLAGLGTHDDAIREELELFAWSKRRVWLADEPALIAQLADVREGDVVVHDRSTRVSLPAGVDVLTYAWRAASPTAGELTLAWRGDTQTALVPLPGPHNGRNAALAIACALVLGRPLGELGAALASVQGPAQRCSILTLDSGCILVDDSYNASPSSVLAALDVLDGFDPALTRLVVLGDMLDLGDESARFHEELVPRLASLAGVHVRLFGERASALAPCLPETLASIGRASPPVDPRALVDLATLERTVVLVKGSRGMALERVVDHVEEINRAASDDAALHVGITGSAARSFAGSLLTRTQTRNVQIRSLDIGDLASGAAARRPSDIAVVTSLDLGGDDRDLESDLAAIAQLLLHVRVGGVAYLCEDGDDGQREAMTLLSDVIPPGIRARRVPSSVLLSAVVSEIRARAGGSSAF